MQRKHNLSSLRRLLPLPLLALAALGHAGHWQVTYSGGFYTDTAPQPHNDGPRPDGWGGQGLTAYGPIKAKFQ